MLKAIAPQSLPEVRSPEQRQSESGQESKHLLSARADALMIGGASILFGAGYWLFVDPKASVYTASWIAFYVAFAINSPHFIASYQLLYGDYRKDIFKSFRFFFAGVVVPVNILIALGFGFVYKDTAVFKGLIHLMYLSVGWHYIKQIFGTIVVTSAVQKFYFSKLERISLRASLFSLWGLSWASANSGGASHEFHGIPYTNFSLPSGSMTAVYTVVLLTMTGTIYLFGRRYLLKGEKPATAAIISFATIYLWYIPVFYHPVFFYFVPAFHSLQYILFVATLERNKTRNAVKNLEGAALRLQTFKKIGTFMLIAVVGGALYFNWVPKTLDKNITFDTLIYGPTFFMFVFDIFINLHHYFIDNAIWRGDNPQLKTHLFQKSA